MNFFRQKSKIKLVCGFTLIELLVVFMLIGLLSTIIIASLSSARAKGRDGRRIADVKSIQLALSLYYTQNGVYPKNIYSTSGSPPMDGLAPSYLPVVPTDPGDGSNYKYAAYSTVSPACGNSLSSNILPVRYRLGAVLEDANNGELSRDVDAPLAGSGSMSGFYTCSGTSDFHGASEACTATAGTDKCYDQIP